MWPQNAEAWSRNEECHVGMCLRSVDLRWMESKSLRYEVLQMVPEYVDWPLM